MSSQTKTSSRAASFNIDSVNGQVYYSSGPIKNEVQINNLAASVTEMNAKENVVYMETSKNNSTLSVNTQNQNKK